MKYKIKYTHRFKKDLKLLKKQGKDINKLYYIIEKSAKGEPLEDKYKDNLLNANSKKTRECHV